MSRTFLDSSKFTPDFSILLDAPIDERQSPKRTAERRQATEAHIRAGGHTKVKRLAREFDVNPTTARRIVRRMRANGEISGTPDQEERP